MSEQEKDYDIRIAEIVALAKKPTYSERIKNILLIAVSIVTLIAAITSWFQPIANFVIRLNQLEKFDDKLDARVKAVEEKNNSMSTIPERMKKVETVLWLITPSEYRLFLTDPSNTRGGGNPNDISPLPQFKTDIVQTKDKSKL